LILCPSSFGWGWALRLKDGLRGGMLKRSKSPDIVRRNASIANPALPR
jgi:hypothetical protein